MISGCSKRVERPSTESPDAPETEEKVDTRGLPAAFCQNLTEIDVVEKLRS